MVSKEELGQRIREVKLESIRKFLCERFGQEHTRESALNMVVDSFFSKYATEIEEVERERHVMQNK